MDSNPLEPGVRLSLITTDGRNVFPPSMEPVNLISAANSPPSLGLTQVR